MSAGKPSVLSIAGSDPSGGAGIQADLKTFSALGVNGCAAPVALTAQNARGIQAIHIVPAAFVAQQLDAVFSDVEVAAVKIGMLGTFEIVEVVIDAIRRYKPSFVVLDPVIRATSGASLLDERGVDLMRRDLLPLADLVTPNTMEAGTLLRREAPITTADARSAAEQLVGIGARNALVTGGHLREDATVVDVLFGTHEMHEFRAARVSGLYTRGTGCRLSSSIAAFVALGIGLIDACAQAQRFVGQTIMDG